MWASRGPCRVSLRAPRDRLGPHSSFWTSLVCSRSRAASTCCRSTGDTGDKDCYTGDTGDKDCYTGDTGDKDCYTGDTGDTGDKDYYTGDTGDKDCYTGDKDCYTGDTGDTGDKDCYTGDTGDKDCYTGDKDCYTGDKDCYTGDTGDTGDKDCYTGDTGDKDCYTGDTGDKDCYTGDTGDTGDKDCYTGDTGDKDCYTGDTGDKDCYTGDKDCYTGDKDRYTGDKDCYTGDTGDKDCYTGDKDCYTGDTGDKDCYTGDKDCYTGDKDCYTGDKDCYTGDTGDKDCYTGDTGDKDCYTGDKDCYTGDTGDKDCYTGDKDCYTGDKDRYTGDTGDKDWACGRCLLHGPLRACLSSVAAHRSRPKRTVTPRVSVLWFPEPPTYLCRDPKIDEATQEAESCRGRLAWVECLPAPNITCRLDNGTELRFSGEEVGFNKTAPCRNVTGYSYKVAVALSLFLGWLGADRFYLGYPALARHLIHLYTHLSTACTRTMIHRRVSRGVAFIRVDSARGGGRIKDLNEPVSGSSAANRRQVREQPSPDQEVQLTLSQLLPDQAAASEPGAHQDPVASVPPVPSLQG
ncbi:unnamed protein product [Boreogadus saida]